MTPVGVVVTTRGRERETGLTTQGILDKACLTSGVKIIPNLPFRIRLLGADYSAPRLDVRSPAPGRQVGMVRVKKCSDEQ